METHPNDAQYVSIEFAIAKWHHNNQITKCIILCMLSNNRFSSLLIPTKNSLKDANGKGKWYLNITFAKTLKKITHLPRAPHKCVSESG